MLTVKKAILGFFKTTMEIALQCFDIQDGQWRMQQILEGSLVERT